MNVEETKYQGQYITFWLNIQKDQNAIVPPEYIDNLKLWAINNPKTEFILYYGNKNKSNDNKNACEQIKKDSFLTYSNIKVVDVDELFKKGKTNLDDEELEKAKEIFDLELEHGQPAYAANVAKLTALNIKDIRKIIADAGIMSSDMVIDFDLLDASQTNKVLIPWGKGVGFFMYTKKNFEPKTMITGLCESYKKLYKPYYNSKYSQYVLLIGLREALKIDSIKDAIKYRSQIIDLNPARYYIMCADNSRLLFSKIYGDDFFGNLFSKNNTEQSDMMSELFFENINKESWVFNKTEQERRDLNKENASKIKKNSNRLAAKEFIKENNIPDNKKNFNFIYGLFDTENKESLSFFVEVLTEKTALQRELNMEIIPFVKNNIKNALDLIEKTLIILYNDPNNKEEFSKIKEHKDLFYAFKRHAKKRRDKKQEELDKFIKIQEIKEKLKFSSELPIVINRPQYQQPKLIVKKTKQQETVEDINKRIKDTIQTGKVNFNKKFSIAEALPNPRFDDAVLTQKSYQLPSINLQKIKETKKSRF